MSVASTAEVVGISPTIAPSLTMTMAIAVSSDGTEGHRIHVQFEGTWSWVGLWEEWDVLLDRNLNNLWLDKLSFTNFSPIHRSSARSTI